MAKASGRSGSARLVMPPGLYTIRTRSLWIDRHWRYVVAAAKRHGHRPDNVTDFTPPYWGCNLVVRGRGIYRDARGRDCPLEPGTFFQRVLGQSHSTLIDPSSGYTECFLSIEPRTASELLQLRLLQPIPVIPNAVTQSTLDQFAQIYQRMGRPNHALMTPMLMLEVLQFLHGLYSRSQHISTAQSWEHLVQHACQTLESDLHERLPGQAVAQRMGVTYASFRRKFHDIKGVSPGEYRIRCRIERACQLLSEHSVKAVAARLGYCDAFAFSSQFRQYVGRSPRAYQRALDGR